MSFFNRRSWRTAQNLGYLTMPRRRRIDFIHELFTEIPYTDGEVLGTIVGIVTSYRYNDSTGRAMVTLLDESGLVNALIDEDIILYGGLIGYVRIGAVIVAKTLTYFTMSSEPPVACVYITFECIVAIISTSGEVIPGNLFNHSDADDDDDGDDDGGNDNVV